MQEREQQDTSAILEPSIRRISREELVSITRPEIGKTEKPVFTMQSWYGDIPARIRKFREENPGMSLDSHSVSLDLALLHEAMRSKLRAFSRHAFGIAPQRLEAIQTVVNHYFTQYFQHRLVQNSPELVSRINEQIAQGNVVYRDLVITPQSEGRDVLEVLGTLPAELLAEVYERLEQIRDENRAQGEEFIETKTAEVKQKYLAARPSLIPDSVKERLDKDLQQVKLKIMDIPSAALDMLSSPEGGADVGGWYSLRSHQVSLYLMGALDETLTHEFTHALSSSRARTIKVAYDSTATVEGGSGFGVHTNRTGKTGRWFNEAVTESITMCLYGKSQEDEGNYPDERKLLQLVLSKGRDSGSEQYESLGFEGVLVEESVITEAYFEDRDPSLPQQQQRPRQKEFYHRIAELYSPGFLNRLDSVERFLGVKVAITLMEQPDFDPQNDGIPHLQTEEEAESYRAVLKSRGLLSDELAT